MSTLAQTSTPKAIRAWVTNGKVWIELEDGLELGFPAAKFPRLRNASAEDLGKVRIGARGKALRWEELDEDLSVRGLLMHPNTTDVASSPERDIIFAQAVESYRYQDALKWSRVKTAALIEAALFYAYQNTNVTIGLKKLALILGAITVLIVSALALLDKLSAKMHLERIKEYENRCGWSAEHLYPAGLGTWLLMIGLLSLSVFNLAMIVSLFRS